MTITPTIIDYDSTKDNQYTLFIFEPLQEITRQEFPGIDIVDGEDPEGNDSFIFTNKPNLLDNDRTSGELRSYEIHVDYDYQGGDKLDRKTRQRLSNVSERFKRMVNNYRQFTIKRTWVDEHGTWVSTLTVWSADRDTYCWHNGRIEEIDMDQDIFDNIQSGHYRVRMIFQCFREETIS